MLVSVIIPNYNHVLYLHKRIESVLNQTIKDIEILILDDCSPDNSRVIIDQYAAKDSRIRTIYNEINSGSTFKQWNKGIALAKGKYVWIAESDDDAEPDLLASLVQLLETDESIVLAYSESFDIDEHSVVKGTWQWFLTELDSLWTADFVADGSALVRRFMSYRNIIPNASAVVMRNSTLREVGPADESYRVFGDWIFWARLLSRGKVAYLTRPLNYFRTHQNNARSKNRVDGTSLEENSRILAAMHQYGTPDATYYRKAVNALLDLWYHTWIYHGLTWQRHRTIFSNIAAIEPQLAQQVLRIASRKFFAGASGFRILLGDRLLYRFLRKK